MVPKATGDARYQWLWVQECRLTSRTVQSVRALNFLFKFYWRREGKGKVSGAVSSLKAHGRGRDLKVGIFWKRGAKLRRGGDGGDRGWDGWMAESMDMRLSKLWEIVKGQRSLSRCSPRGSRESDTTQQWKNNNKQDGPEQESKPHHS